MSSVDLAHTKTSRLEEFIALNDELAALVRSGLPLELGLGGGGQRTLAGRITERLQSGRSLEEALRTEGDVLPPVYRAVVEAGLRSGKLADAVETISRAARAMVRLRRRMMVASIYPTLVIVVAFILAALVLPRMLLSVFAITGEHGEPPSRILRAVLILLNENSLGWLFWLPALLMIILWATGGLTSIALRFPGLNGLLRPFRIAAFAELAAGLLEHGVSFDEAIVMAADASGDRALARDAKSVAERVRAGEPAGGALADCAALPRFARWMVSTGAAQGTLVATLRHVAEWADRKGAAHADWYSFAAPTALTVFVGGAAVATFAALSLGPVINVIYKLAGEMSL